MYDLIIYLPHINFTGTRVALVESVPRPDPVRSNVVPGHDSVAEIGKLKRIEANRY